MVRGLQRFEIALNNVDGTFSPGEVLSGNVIIELGRPKSVRGVKLRIKGKAQVKWSENSGTGKSSTTTWYTNDEEYFRMDYIMVSGSGNVENVVIEPGYHVFPFEFCLPHNIPSSFEHDHGNVRYTIKAIMDRPWKFDHQTTMMFMVETPYDVITQCPTAMDVIEDEEIETFCCFPCIDMGAMRVHVHVPKRGFSVGETIEANISIDNHSRSVKVQEVKLSLVQKLEFYSRHPLTKTNKCSKVLERSEQSGPIAKKAELIMNVHVPSANPSNFPHCRIMDIQYGLNVEIRVSGCHCSVTKSYSIEIGTKQAQILRAIPNAFVTPGSIDNPPSFEQIQSNLPSAPFFVDPNTPFPMPIADQERTNTASIPNLPSTSGPGFQYPRASIAPIGFVDPSSGQTPTSTGFAENPPPTYDDCMKTNEKK